MQLKFENICTQTPIYLTELARGTVKKGYLFVSLLPGLLVLAMGIYTLVQKGFGFTSGLMIVVALALGVSAYGAPMRLANQAAKKNRKQYGSDVTVSLRFFEDGIKAHNQQMETDAEVRYDQIERIVESRHLYLLVLREKMALMVDKEGFTFGAGEKFLPFLREKCSEAASR